MRIRHIVAIGGGAVIAGAIALGAFGPRQAPPGQPPLARLSDEAIGALREAFNAHADETRLVVLLSPT